MASLIKNSKKWAGFTLIELMITVSIIGLLTILVYPSYISSVQQARRSDGKSTLLDVQAQLERCYTQSLSYSTCIPTLNLPVTSPETYYTVNVSGTAATTTYTLAATAVGVQAQDTQCAVFFVNQLGQQTANTNAGAANTNCW